MLAQRVQAGELSAVAERLPEQPCLVQSGTLVGADFVEFQPGAHGETLQLPHDSADFDGPILIASWEPLLWAPGGFESGSPIEGNLVEGYEASADDTVFTFHMRKGMRWSDGEPLTTQDVRFAIDDVLRHERLGPLEAYDRQLLRAGKRPGAALAQLTVIDDFTFSLTFDAPYGAFPALIGPSYGHIFKPRHYLEQFHQDYANGEDLRKLLQEEGMGEDEWAMLFINKQYNNVANVTSTQRIGHPALTPWVLAEADSEVVRYERNPYYFKVDTDGNQLPYADEIRAQVVQDPETLISRALFGEFDYPGERMSLRHVPLLSEKADEDELTLHLPRAQRSPVTFELNLTHPDEVWRQVVRDVRFRRALSLAIDRQEIIDTFFLGEFGHVPERVNDGTFDPAEAERLLDAMGLEQRNNDGWRLGPDGEVFTVPFEVFPATEDDIPMTELVVEYWKNVGVHTTLRQVDQTVHTDLGNEIKAHTHNLPDPDTWTTNAIHYLPVPFARWGELWWTWYDSQGEQGEEPPDEVKELFELHERMLSVPFGSEEANAALEGLWENHRSNVWNIVPVEISYRPVFFDTRIENIPEGVQDVFAWLVNQSMEQWSVTV